MKRVKYFVHVLVLLVLGVACDDPECQRDNDCFADEWCNSGICDVGARPGPNNVMSTNNSTPTNNQSNSSNNANGSNNTNSNNTNNATTNPNNTNGSNNSNNANNTNGTNNSNNSNNEPGGVCKADIFDSCEDPLEATRTDNSWSDARNLGSSGGCLSGDAITERSNPAEGVICPRDPGDWYNQIIVPCDSVTLTVEVRVTPDPGCESDEWSIGINRGGASIPCSDARLNCFDDGITKVVRWTISPSNSVESWYFGVVNAETSAFKYQAELNIR